MNGRGRRSVGVPGSPVPSQSRRVVPPSVSPPPGGPLPSVRSGPRTIRRDESARREGGPSSSRYRRKRPPVRAPSVPLPNDPVSKSADLFEKVRPGHHLADGFDNGAPDPATDRDHIRVDIAPDIRDQLLVVVVEPVREAKHPTEPPYPGPVRLVQSAIDRMAIRVGKSTAVVSGDEGDDRTIRFF